MTRQAPVRRCRLAKPCSYSHPFTHEQRAIASPLPRGFLKWAGWPLQRPQRSAAKRDGKRPRYASSSESDPDGPDEDSDSASDQLVRAGKLPRTADAGKSCLPREGPGTAQAAAAKAGHLDAKPEAVSKSGAVVQDDIAGTGILWLATKHGTSVHSAGQTGQTYPIGFSGVRKRDARASLRTTCLK
jgi:hypothetical protein